MRAARECLEDVLNAIAQIEKYSSLGREAFDEDETIQVWMVHFIQIIGEACAKLPKSLRNRHPEVPWEDIITMRHVLVHEYFDIEYDEVWCVIQYDLPNLKELIPAF